MAESTKKSVMAIVKEVTEGTPVIPTLGSQFIAIQSGYSLTPEFENLENAELSGTVGKRAPIIGSESPKASINHYMRASGVVATEPNFGGLIEGAIGEKVAAHGTERLTTTGSTAGTSSAPAVVKLASGGSDFQRGKAMLIKDPAGYQLRPVHSMATNDATLGFNLPSASPSGIGTGRAILYKPADAPPTFTVVDYRGQGGATQMIAGVRVSEMSIDAVAKVLLNTSFSLEGIKFYYDPIEITASTKFIDFNDGAPKSVSIAAKCYSNPIELAVAMQDAMNSVSSGITVTYYSSGANAGKFNFTKASGTFELDFGSGSNQIAPKIGFAASDLTGFLTYTSATVQSWASPVSPSFDAGEPQVVKDNEFFLGSYSDYGCSGAQSVKVTVTNSTVKVPDICSESGYGSSILDQREAKIEAVLTMMRHDADKFYRFKEGQTTRALFNFGKKAGGNWVEGNCGMVYAPQCKISAFSLDDKDGIVTVNLTLTAFVSSDGLGEIYLNFA